MKPKLFPCCLAALVATAGPAVAESFVKNEQDREKIEQALPKTAPARPERPRRLLIFTLNVNYGGHPSIAYANEAFALMGKKTGTFETTVTADLAVFERENLQKFDAVFFNNTVGNCFTNADLRRNLLEFVTGGGGLLGVHGTTVAFTQWPGAVEDWPEFGFMLGGRGANHKDSTERVWIKVEDLASPITRMFDASGFEYRDEFFRVHDTYSRSRVRVLLSIDTDKTDVKAGQPRGNCYREDNDYALAWIRNYGRGRVFYCTIAHNPYVFWDPRMLEFYLAAIQFALGDLQVPTTPSARVSPAVRAQEKLGWRLGVEACTSNKFTFFEAIEKTAQLGLLYIGGVNFQKVSQEISKNFDPGLTDAELGAIRLKLEAAGLRLLTYSLQDIPGDEPTCRKIFEFGRKMGIETFISESKPEALPLIDRFCQEYRINVALHNRDQKASPLYWRPENVLLACQGHSKRIGACGDVGGWLRSGIDPIKAAQLLGPRLLTVQMHDVHAAGPDAHDLPWGTGVGRAEEFIRELARLGVKPCLFGIDLGEWHESMPKVQQCIDFFNTLTLKLNSK